MSAPRDSSELLRAAWTIQAGFVRKWIFSFQTHSRETKWTRQCGNTNFIRRRQKMRKAIQPNKRLTESKLDRPPVFRGTEGIATRKPSDCDANVTFGRPQMPCNRATRWRCFNATNIMSIYNQYRWRLRRQVRARTKRRKRLRDDDAWQSGYLKAGSKAPCEIDCWVGE